MSEDIRCALCHYAGVSCKNLFKNQNIIVCVLLSHAYRLNVGSVVSEVCGLAGCAGDVDAV